MGWKKEVKIDDYLVIQFRDSFLEKDEVYFKVYFPKGNIYKGFKEALKTFRVDRGIFNFIVGNVKFRSNDNRGSTHAFQVRRAWLKVEDELARRGWINIDAKKEKKKS